MSASNCVSHTVFLTQLSSLLRLLRKYMPQLFPLALTSIACCMHKALHPKSQSLNGSGGSRFQQGSSVSSIGSGSLEDIPLKKPSLEDRVRDLEAELVRVRRRSSNSIGSIYDDCSSEIPPKLVNYDPISLKEPQTLHNWDWLSKGKWGWTRWFMVEDVFHVSPNMWVVSMDRYTSC